MKLLVERTFGWMLIGLMAWGGVDILFWSLGLDAKLHVAECIEFWRQVLNG